jgi:lipid II:glycine glycyltransferase (peptidoglycan interpeptide bridge formation enzyme)
MEAFHDLKSWNETIAPLPGANILQTREWAQVKQPVGWQALPLVWRDPEGRVQAAALALKRELRLGGLSARLCVIYVPRGPLLDWSDEVLRNQVLADLATFAKKQGAIFIKIDPPVWLGRGEPGASDALDDPLGLTVQAGLEAGGWGASDEQVQFKNTMWIDLRPNEDDLLLRMSQKGRYNVRLAERKGVTVRPAHRSELPLLYGMYAETARRDHFVIRDEDYYLRLWGLMMDAGLAEPLIAEVDGQATAGVIVLRFAGQAVYLHGMSLPEHREKMPNHLLQWQAMRRAKAAGCHTYDLWGAPDSFDETDRMWGVYRFKTSLGGVVLRGLGAYDLPTRPFYYRLYTNLLPRLLDVMRSRARRRLG